MQAVTQESIQHARARATWVLRRRHSVPTEGERRRSVAALMPGGRATGVAAFAYAELETHVRPTPLTLLRALWQAGGRSMSVEEVCQVLYGRPGTLRAVRQAAFRASRALDRVACPLLVHCRSGQVFLWRRGASFDYAVPVKPVRGSPSTAGARSAVGPGPAARRTSGRHSTFTAECR